LGDPVFNHGQDVSTRCFLADKIVRRDTKDRRDDLIAAIAKSQSIDRGRAMKRDE
jgi:hypothetical protein